MPPIIGDDIMNTPLLLPLALLLSPGAPSQDPPQQIVYVQDRLLLSESDLNIWCQQEARAHFVARNVTPYQWTSRYYNRSNVLYVEGTLRAGGKDVEVRCQAPNGVRERDASIEIKD